MSTRPYSEAHNNPYVRFLTLSLSGVHVYCLGGLKMIRIAVVALGICQNSSIADETKRSQMKNLSQFFVRSEA